MTPYQEGFVEGFNWPNSFGWAWAPHEKPENWLNGWRSGRRHAINMERDNPMPTPDANRVYHKYQRAKRYNSFALLETPLNSFS